MAHLGAHMRLQDMQIGHSLLTQEHVLALARPLGLLPPPPGIASQAVVAMVPVPPLPTAPDAAAAAAAAPSTKRVKVVLRERDPAEEEVEID
jgi:hypothetical protein